VRTSPSLLTLPALALALVLTGCGGDDDSSASSEPTSASSPSEETSPSDDATEDTGSTGAADGTVTTDLVTFSAPDGWQVVTPEDAQAMTSGEAIEDGASDFLDQAGVSADQLVQLIGQSDAIVLSDKGRVDGFFDNVNVISQAGAPATEDVLEQQLGQIGATVEDVTTETVAGQEVPLVSYLLPVGEVEVQGRGLQVPVGDQTVTITVSAREAATADDAVATIVGSLTTLG
jgi:hypothetical protein